MAFRGGSRSPTNLGVREGQGKVVSKSLNPWLAFSGERKENEYLHLSVMNNQRSFVFLNLDLRSITFYWYVCGACYCVFMLFSSLKIALTSAEF